MQLFLDMDGVLADFDKRATEVLGMLPSIYEGAYGSAKFWEALNAEPAFFKTFDMMLDARFLLDAVLHLNPWVITGLPSTGAEKVADHKRSWIADEIPWLDGRVITCKSKDKSNWCRYGDVIVDDRIEYRHLWEAKGGIWVHHTSAYESIKQLKELGVI